MIRTINVSTEVSPRREVHLVLPDDVPPGPADLVVVIIPREGNESTGVTGRTSQVTQLLDQIYATESSTIDPGLLKMQVASLKGEKW